MVFAAQLARARHASLKRASPMPMGPRVPARIDVVQSSSRLSGCVESHRDAVGDGEAFDRLEQHDDDALKRLEEGLEVLGAQARARGLLL